MSTVAGVLTDDSSPWAVSKRTVDDILLVDGDAGKSLDFHLELTDGIIRRRIDNDCLALSYSER